MTFLALIIALLYIQFVGTAHVLHRDEWFESWHEVLANAGLRAWPLLLFQVFVPALLLFWLFDSLGGWLGSLLYLGGSVVILLYSFGRGDYEKAMSAYREDCRNGDFEAAFIKTRELFPCDDCDADPDNAEQLHRWMKQRLLYMGFERWFAVIFYFALFGAAGALAYRLVHLSEIAEDKDPHQQQLIHILDWLPSRLLMFAYALTGDYMGSREQIMSALQDLEVRSDEAINDAAHAALGFKPTVFAGNGDSEALAQVSEWEMGQLHSLMSRSAASWVVVLALWVVFT